MKKLFKIPVEHMDAFAGALVEKELANEIKGVSKNGDVKVTVEYDADQRYEVFELTELVENDFDVEETE